MNDTATEKPGRIIAVENSPPASLQTEITPMTMIQTVIERGGDLDQLQKMMDFQERWEANEAKKAYIRAMTEFKANPPEIVKTKDVAYGNTAYSHAELDRISTTIGQSLSKHQLSHTWKTEQLEGGTIRVTCIITHELGHSESVSLQAGADQSGSKNNIQAIGSTVTYLERYTLLAATGLAAKGQDTDATDVVEWITEDQAAVLESLIEVVGADRHRFLKYMGALRLDRIRASAYGQAVKALESKRKSA